MSCLTITDAKGRPHDVFIEFDERRSMWRFQGLGFDFWAYPIAGGDDIDDLDASTACFQAEASRTGNESGRTGSATVHKVMEREDVRRTGDESDRTVLLSIACPPSGELTEDIFVSKCLKELGRFWDLFGEFEDAE